MSDDEPPGRKGKPFLDEEVKELGIFDPENGDKFVLTIQGRRILKMRREP